MKIFRKKSVNMGFLILVLILMSFYVKNTNLQSGVIADSVGREVVSTDSPNVFYNVVYVVDGDTLDVLINGQKERVRLLGVNTPEVVDPRKPVQCYGPEASAIAKQKLQNSLVKLEADLSQGDKDKYGRLLRYVFLQDGTNFDQWLIANGYGFEYTYDKPYLYQSEFKSAQLKAQTEQLGLWSKDTCNGQ